MVPEWFVVRDGKEIGPFTLAVLKDRAAKGFLTPDTLIRHINAKAPVKAGTIKELFAEVETKPSAYPTTPVPPPLPSAIRDQPTPIELNEASDEAKSLNSDTSPSSPLSVLLEIGKWQRWLILSVMLCLCFVLVDVLLVRGAIWAGLVLSSVIWPPLCYILARALQKPPVLYAALASIPLINVVVLLDLNGWASRVLRAAGVKVGLLGAKVEAREASSSDAEDALRSCRLTTPVSLEWARYCGTTPPGLIIVCCCLLAGVVLLLRPGRHSPADERAEPVSAGSSGAPKNAPSGDSVPPKATENRDADDEVVSGGSALGAFDYGGIDVHARFDIEDWRNGAAYATAYHFVIADADIPGKLEAEEVVKAARTLATNAAKSPIANQLGATVRIAQTNTMKPNSEAVALAGAVEAGRTIYGVAGRTRFTYASYSDWAQTLADGGVEGRTAAAFRAQTAANERVVQEKRLDVLARLHQGRVDVAPVISSCYRSAMTRSLPRELSPMIDDLAAHVAVALLSSVPPTKIHDPDAVVAILVAKLRGMNVAESQIDRKVLRIVASDGYGQLEQRVRTSRSLAGYRSAAGLILMHHKAILAETLKECGR